MTTEQDQVAVTQDVVMLFADEAFRNCPDDFELTLDLIDDIKVAMQTTFDRLAATRTGQATSDVAMRALEQIEDLWVSNNSDGDDYDEGYDDGLKLACDVARAALATLTQSEEKA